MYLNCFWKLICTAVNRAILKKMSVGGNPSCCNLEALQALKVFSGFLEIYQNIF